MMKDASYKGFTVSLGNPSQRLPGRNEIVLHNSGALPVVVPYGYRRKCYVQGFCSRRVLHVNPKSEQSV